MKFFTVILFYSLFSQPISNVDRVRNKFPNIVSKDQADAFIMELKNDNSPESKAYIAAMIFMKSRFVKFPFTKMKYFKEGKNLLDETILKNPENIEIRYIRFLMQKEIPSFLGYDKNINEDFEVILNGVTIGRLNLDLKLKILHNMLQVKDITVMEENRLNQLIKRL
ncbi:hypothetical protein [uncultured Lutibacter sp.]|uniref:hypothetical protein n=1 Tax=uncultured Lutibacter sp. TaxID=437739 RepID=UPI00260CE4C9|nr:hypothetical protein [uncultured Lutibacter sp.]